MLRLNQHWKAARDDSRAWIRPGSAACANLRTRNGGVEGSSDALGDGDGRGSAAALRQRLERIIVQCLGSRVDEGRRGLEAQRSSVKADSLAGDDPVWRSDGRREGDVVDRARVVGRVDSSEREARLYQHDCCAERPRTSHRRSRRCWPTSGSRTQRRTEVGRAFHFCRAPERGEPPQHPGRWRRCLQSPIPGGHCRG